MSEKLALEGLRPSQVLDSLAYVDVLSDSERENAETLIKDELKKSKRSGKRPEDCIAHLRPVSEFLQFRDHPILQGEMARIQRGQRHMTPMDTSRSNLETPRLHDQQNLSAWQASASNAAAQLEHQYTRICNYKLGAKYGPATWRAHNARTAMLGKHLERELADIEEKIDGINKRRKLQQEAAQDDLGRLWSEYQQLVKKNIEIEVACQPLALEVESGLHKLPPGQGPSLNGHVAGAGGNFLDTS